MNGKWLAAQRSRDGLFGGLWEFPGIDTPTGIEPVPYLEQKLGEMLGFDMRVKQALAAFEHQLSHRIFLVKPFFCEPVRKEEPLEAMTHEELPYAKYQWVTLEKFQNMGISAITSRIVAELKHGSLT
jgi:adenine-specific DNA glycosylase